LEPADFFRLFILPGLIAGLWGAGLVAYGLFCLLPALRAAGAGPAAMVAGYVLTALGPVVAALAALLALPPLWLVALSLIVLVVGSYPNMLVKLTGGPQAMEAGAAALFAEIEAAQRSFDIGDIEAWQAALGRLDRGMNPEFKRYVDLVQRFAREEVGRREGSRQSSRETLIQIQREATRIRSARRPPSVVLGAILMLGFVVAAAPSLAVDVARGVEGTRVCPDALERADGASWAGSGIDIAAWPISHLVLVDPAVAATLVFDGRLSLDDAAVSRHNPRARDLLEENGYRDGYLRAWETSDGRLVQAEILVFDSAQGARAFHRAFTAYACRFSSQAFAGPADAVGLRVRYGTGDPFREQLTWVDGTMRVQVSRSFETEPIDHSDIQTLAANQLKQLAHPE
jgi:hypothetical protein